MSLPSIRSFRALLYTATLESRLPSGLVTAGAGCSVPCAGLARKFTLDAAFLLLLADKIARVTGTYTTSTLMYDRQPWLANGALAACRTIAFRTSFPAFVALAVFFKLS